MRTAVAAAVLVAASALTGGAEPAPVLDGNAPACGHGPDTAGARVRPGSGVDDPGELGRARQRSMERHLRQALRDVGDRRGVPEAISVPVRVHVITRDDGSGGVSNRRVIRQLAVVNRAFAGATADAAASTPFRFVLRSTDRTRSTDWFRWTIADDDRPAKRALHRGGRDTLNIYVARLPVTLLGYATFPVPQPLYRDGLVLAGGSLPGGGAAPYDRGETGTHEIGHWLALYHTFQGSCGAPGDRVSDTPRQAAGTNVYRCSDSLDTCTAPGRDPVHNFMSYGSDDCLDMFTAGQSDRMVDAWTALRAR